MEDNVKQTTKQRSSKMKWTVQEMKKLNEKGGQMVDKAKTTPSVRELSVKLQSKYFKNRSVESVRHKIRQLVG